MAHKFFSLFHSFEWLGLYRNGLQNLCFQYFPMNHVILSIVKVTKSHRLATRSSNYIENSIVNQIRDRDIQLYFHHTCVKCVLLWNDAIFASSIWRQWLTRDANGCEVKLISIRNLLGIIIKTFNPQHRFISILLLEGCSIRPVNQLK